jgi:light-regulated signal transduction histidine kinase (bacteriophytochrome)
MPTSNLHQSVELKPASLVILEARSEASVYASGFIQPHGFLLILQEPSLTILQVSNNVE